MAMGMGGGIDRGRPMSEINVTPLVDIMLVLLIIFMVAAPLMSTGVEVDLPQEQTNAIATDNEPLMVTVAADGRAYLEEQPITPEELVVKVSALRQGNPQLPVYVRGDREAAYGAVMGVMARLQQAGIDKVGLVTESP